MEEYVSEGTSLLEESNDQAPERRRNTAIRHAEETKEEYRANVQRHADERRALQTGSDTYEKGTGCIQTITLVYIVILLFIGGTHAGKKYYFHEVPKM